MSDKKEGFGKKTIEGQQVLLKLFLEILFPLIKEYFSLQKDEEKAKRIASMVAGQLFSIFNQYIGRLNGDMEDRIYIPEYFVSEDDLLLEKMLCGGLEAVAYSHHISVSPFFGERGILAKAHGSLKAMIMFVEGGLAVFEGIKLNVDDQGKLVIFRG